MAKNDPKFCYKFHYHIFSSLPSRDLIRFESLEPSELLLASSFNKKVDQLFIKL